ncbi:MAG: hypothetical protein KDE48_21870, partial [Anaerolineales bacterium]|nr:hypothetical protein [Anaerolineales bacterium]
MQTAVSTPPINLYDLDREALSMLLARWDYSDYHAAQIWDYLYQQQITNISAMTDLRPALGQQLLAAARIDPLTVQVAVDSSDGHTRKYLLQLGDGETIETVLMYFKGRATAC